MNQYKCRIHGFIKNKDVHHWHYTDENEKCDCEPVEAKAEAGEPVLCPICTTPTEIWRVCPGCGEEIAPSVSLPEDYLPEDGNPRINQMLKQGTRPDPAYALREDFLAFCEVVLKWLDAPMGFRAVSLEDIHAMTRKHISALRQSAKEGA